MPRSYMEGPAEVESDRCAKATPGYSGGDGGSAGTSGRRSSSASSKHQRVLSAADSKWPTRVNKRRYRLVMILEGATIYRLLCAEVTMELFENSFTLVGLSLPLWA